MALLAISWHPVSLVDIVWAARQQAQYLCSVELTYNESIVQALDPQPPLAFYVVRQGHQPGNYTTLKEVNN